MFGWNKKKNNGQTPMADNNSVHRESTTQSSAKVILTKAEDGLNRHIVNLKKEKNVDLTKHCARVAVVLDRSGSMDRLFRNGSVQETLTRLLPLALRFDDNGELEVYVFNNSYKQLSSMTIKNFETYVQKEIMRKGYGPDGGTNYAPVIERTISDYNDGSPYPAFVIFITDGDNWDKSETDRVIRKSSKYKIFYQFVGIGNASFNYLRELDDLDGRAVDNTAFIQVSDFSRLDDEQLYAKLLDQYPEWLRAMHIN